MTTKILVTGAAGNVGSALVHRLVEDKDSFILAVDNLSTGYMHNLPQGNQENFRFIKCDVNEYLDISAIMTYYDFDYVFHYAAIVGVERTLHNPIKVLKDIEGFKNIFNLSKNTGVKRVFFSSSSEVYGESIEFPQHEEITPLNSKLTYAVVKNVGESFLKAFQKEYGLDYTILRFFNTYGPSQTVDFVIPRYIIAALHDRDITIYGDGKQTRTFCYIDDNVEAVVRILKDKLYINDVVNIGSDVEYNIEELAGIILRLTGSGSKITFLPSLKEGDMTRRRPDITKMKKVLNRELIPIEEGILKMIHHIQHKK